SFAFYFWRISMPPRWPRQPDRADTDYRRLDDRMNFALHVALFSAFNSGLWFFQILSHPWENLSVVTIAWGLGLLGHGLYVFVISD
ncbi:MAG: 2TM domain-containing protein, partial [Prochlorotrichaceae cyanobacterium]